MQAKRKLAALLLSLCMVLGMLPMTVFAAGETTAEGLVYEVNGESVTITGYTGNEASVVIPNEIEGKPVTAIGKAAFFNCGNLTSIEIPEGIESIGVQAFQLCKKLESVKIPASVISIEERAFQSCSNLDSVTFAEGSRLETINNFAFNDCGKLTSIEFPSGTKSIGNQAFTYCTSLTSIKIPSSVTTNGMKLTEMHLDDWTIAKLLGHSSVRNVKYYRKMSNQLLADETRKARQRLSAVILDNLDGWEAEYEQIRQDDRLQ